MTHPLIHIKDIPPEFIALQKELNKDENFDVAFEARKAGNIEEALGTIAAKLNIALDGLYDVPDICNILAKALAKRGGNIHPSQIDPRLKIAQVVEEIDAYEQVFGKEREF